MCGDIMATKKIGVVTVYSSMNCGSFLQAYGMAIALKNMGYKAVFLDTKSRCTWKVAGREFLAKSRRLYFREAMDAIRKMNIYNRYAKMLDTCKSITKCDAYILGSDELWNMKRKEMYDYPIFWGEGLPPKQTMSYAPSLNVATCEDVVKFPFAMKMLNDMFAVSVRDERSKHELEKITERDIEVVCDPTFLCQREIYTALEDGKEQGDYVFVYEYSNISSEEIALIKEYAQKHNKKIVAMGADHKWADESVVSDPGKFLSLIKHADSVITGTFHGTVFSVIYKKRLASLARKNAKVHEVLKEYHMENRIVTETNSLDQILSLPVDEDQIENIMRQKREKGLLYLNSNLKKILGRADEC